jgi:hypothetical protein
MNNIINKKKPNRRIEAQIGLDIKRDPILKSSQGIKGWRNGSSGRASA